jgi:CDP-diacylglycerol--serine O-phosphatidyltransferase
MMKKHIPNFITSLNLTSGFIAIILAAGGDLTGASWLIVAAMIFDFFDGFSARMLKAYSDIGKELDSLADVVSFGVAPAVIIYKILTGAMSSGMPLAGGLHPIILVAALMPVCAALRLAVFNLDSTQSTGFKGLATPANAIAVISLVIAARYSGSDIISSVISSPLIITALTVTLSLLMVSRIELFSLKVSHLRLKGNEGRYLMLLLIAISFAILGVSAAALIIPIYIVSSLVSRLF